MAQQKILSDYSNVMLVTYQRTKIRGETLWKYFVTEFLLHTVDRWNRPMVCEFIELLVYHGVLLEPDSMRGPVEAVVDVIYRRVKKVSNVKAIWYKSVRVDVFKIKRRRSRKIS